MPGIAPAGVGVGRYFTSVTTEIYTCLCPLGYMFSSHA